jgi:hypothetical protein
MSCLFLRALRDLRDIAVRATKSYRSGTHGTRFTFTTRPDIKARTEEQRNRSRFDLEHGSGKLGHQRETNQ